MANFTNKLSKEDIEFIKKQKMFFVSTSPKSGKINISPKGLDDTFKIIDENKILWLNYFGSGNETAAHLLEDDRMTIMFCAFEGEANILRLYCKAKTIQEKDKDWNEYIKHFSISRAARQVFEVTIESVNNSCGMGVPLYDFNSQREQLTNYYDNTSKEEHIAYMKKKNQISFDGKPTKLFED
jgi:Pyridoxamine 5'-phosphate oxidase